MLEEEIDLRGSANLTPRPVRYCGVKFRSTLEARYALLFDLIQLKWQYEPRLFWVEPHWYLPDFYFPSLGVWGEVKPKNLNAVEMEKAIGLTRVTRQRIILLVGLPQIGPYNCLPTGQLSQTFMFSRLRRKPDTIRKAVSMACTHVF